MGAVETTPLAARRCVKCEPGTPKLESAEIKALSLQVPDWQVERTAGHPVLARTFRFKGFMPGVDLMNRIAAIAEQEGHHPDVCLGWGYVTVNLWTHAAGGSRKTTSSSPRRSTRPNRQSLNTMTVEKSASR